jgi:hypothetical protein
MACSALDSSGLSPPFLSSLDSGGFATATARSSNIEAVIA